MHTYSTYIQYIHTYIMHSYIMLLQLAQYVSSFMIIAYVVVAAVATQHRTHLEVSRCAYPLSSPLNACMYVCMYVCRYPYIIFRRPWSFCIESHTYIHTCTTYTTYEICSLSACTYIYTCIYILCYTILVSLSYLTMAHSFHIAYKDQLVFCFSKNLSLLLKIIFQIVPAKYILITMLSFKSIIY